ncbi:MULTISPECIES: DUF4124 domain-containing protein [Gammaproteobacteria]|uniref:DUF4124 domain-containing protein n=1 Tax=Vreelandella halophila TaxID=86177 RepID=A0A9X5B6M2_9GAMM|nr:MULTISPECIES: DUF4124 domain-containing protein [Gammaproteobacteria]KAA8983630.1 DUF4124 domain-containing protein [Halospina sp. K52047b]MYL27327.1 DUF4124 domain-containing protein [Halomonas utahensis]MYL76006.1 DUF4124 domain-containing protein [Halomonas sp. 22501_18_FS]
MPASVLRIPVAPLLAMFMVATVHAEIFTWTDEEGVTHYTDQPGKEGAEEATSPELANSPMELPEPGTWKPERENREDDDNDHKTARETVSARERRCQRYEERLSRVNEELGRGYREPRGNRLRAERRELRSKIFSEC